MKEKQNGGLSGKLDDAASLLQLIAIRNIPGVLNATNAEKRTASFVFEKGVLVRGRAGDKKGEEAVHDFVAHWNNGSFDFCQNTSALEDSSECAIERPLHTILLAAYKDLHCSFCGKSGSEVEKLVEGPKVLICNECIRSFGSRKNPANN
jgi:hypothetical protein